MPRKATQNVDLAFRGKDLGVYATITKMQRVTASLNPAFASAQSSMAAFGAASTVMGGRVAGVSSVISQLAGVLGKGGAFGVAIAGATIGIGALAKVAWDFASAAADVGDQVFDLSKRLSVSTEFISEMGFVARQNGSSMDALGTAIRSVSRRASLGQPAFKKFNVEIYDSNGNLKNAEGLFMAAVKAINALDSDAEKTAASMELLGDAGAGMLQVIKLGADGIDDARLKANEFGLTLSGEAAVSANIFNNELGALGDAIGGVKREISEGMLPTFTALFRMAQDLIVEIRDMGQSFAWLSRAIAPFKALVDYNIGAVDLLSDALGYSEDVANDVASAQQDLEKQLDNSTGKLHSQTNAVKEARGEWSKFSGEMSAAIAAQMRIEDEAQKRTQELFAKHDEWLNEWAQNSLDLRIQKANEEADLEEAKAKVRLDHIKMVEDAQKAAAASAVNAISNGFQQVIVDSDNAGLHMIRAVVDAAQAAVLSYASSAAAGAAFSQAGIPIIGPVLAAGAAATVFGLVKGLLSTIPQYQSGGVVPGPNRGRDDQLILAHGGEVYYAKDEHDEMLAMMRANAGGIHLHQHTVISPTSAEITKQYRTLKAHESRLRRLGA